MSVPPRFQQDALSRPESDQECRTCGLAYKAHGGQLCAICGAPIEHHDVERPDGGRPLRFAECLAGRIRMAAARRGAGVALTEFDDLVLAEAP